MNEKKKKEGVIVTKNLFDEKTIDGKTIKYIPLGVFLLLDLKV